MLVHAFEGIYKFDENGNTILGQAEKVDVSDDGLTWDITLRDDIKWSDGEPVTVDDFIYSWQRAASPETASDYANLFDVRSRAALMCIRAKPIRPRWVLQRWTTPT